MTLGRTLALFVALPLAHAQASCSDECGAREQAFECSGPRLGAELAASLWGAGSGYDKHIRPAAASAWRDRGSQQGSHWPLEKDHVSVQMQLLSIDSVSTKLQLLEVELYLRVVWHDWRLRYNCSYWAGIAELSERLERLVELTLPRGRIAKPNNIA